MGLDNIETSFLIDNQIILWAAFSVCKNHTVFDGRILPFAKNDPGMQETTLFIFARLCRNKINQRTGRAIQTQYINLHYH